MNKKLFGMYEEHLRPFLDLVIQKDIPGDVVEFGVYEGQTFLPMAQACQVWAIQCHGVDSFCGLAKPGPQDWVGLGEGHYNVGGSESLQAKARDLCLSNVSLHVGFVPAILHELVGCRFCFAHVDLDHYQPTLDTLSFLLPRMSLGAIIMVHDYIPERAGGAAQACRDFCQSVEMRIDYYEPTNHAILRFA